MSRFHPVRAVLLLVGAVVEVVLVHALLGSAPAASAPVPAGDAAFASRSVRDEPEGHWPLAPRPDVVGVFDPPAHPWGPGHRGVDLAGHPGQVVRSALPGTVAFAGSIAGKPVVTVDHDGRRTTYEPVVATVEKGDVVGGGQAIGRLGVVHGHCLPAACLHWGLVRGETYLDPLSLVGGGPVRLLPLWRDDPVVASRRPWRPPLEVWRPPLQVTRPPLQVTRPPLELARPLLDHLP